MEHKQNVNYTVSYTASVGAGFAPASWSAAYNVRMSIGDSADDVTVPTSNNQLTIMGFPVWKLKGVTEDNLDSVRDTGMWVEILGEAGLSGWCICVPFGLQRAVFADLKKSGISIDGPVVDNKGERVLWGVTTGIAITLIGIMLGGGIGAIIGFVFGYSIGNLLIWLLKPRHRYGEDIKRLTKKPKRCDEYKGPDYFGDPIYSLMPINASHDPFPKHD